MTKWRKSSHSGGSSGQLDCVEVAGLQAGIGLRDSKAPERGHLTISAENFARLVQEIKSK